ncbi:Rv3654c family TadE-like protein [uncultured Demequina sp.]|uniref:Rv3654c family TadE-like protein n=1 Tax=uncultured Demequina sp. TaxID=693499 RepID=UPI00260129E0|nr:Rv3654c family TadE-like protein [uncultured Demequina sp.]
MSERGSATVLALALVVVALVLGAAVVALAGQAHARVLAQHAADAAALAGARQARTAVASAQIPDGVACEAARRVARAVEAELASCVVRGADVTAEATVYGVSAVAVAGPRNTG